MEVSSITYDANSAVFKKLSSVDEISRYGDSSKITWINICGTSDAGAIKKLGALFGLHPLSIEDILNTKQQPKTEIFETYKFISIKTIQREKRYRHVRRSGKPVKTPDNEFDEFVIDQISVIVIEHTLITIQEMPGDSFDGIRKSILNGEGKIRALDVEYLAYSIIDAVVDEYFLTINHLEEDIEEFEEHATTTTNDKFIEELQDTKKYLLRIKRAILPLKENMTLITRQNSFFQSEALKPFLQDLRENLNNALASVDHYREWLSNIMDVNLSVLSYQMNKIMKVLAIISTIFIPLTFIAGVYGMNFEYMPETKCALGYPVVLGAMGCIAFVMIVIFKIRRWF